MLRPEQTGDAVTLADYIGSGICESNRNPVASGSRRGMPVFVAVNLLSLGIRGIVATHFSGIGMAGIAGRGSRMSGR